MDISVRQITEIEQTFDEIVSLYADAGWILYTKHPVQLKQAFEQSAYIMGAYVDGELVGILRAVGDNVSIMYVQDLLVYHKYQRNGIGKKLLESFTKQFKDVRQKLLMTDHEERNEAFYRSCGFIPVEGFGESAFISCT